ncbi:hypothetical protein ACLOJK_002335 [Asimina triloba]
MAAEPISISSTIVVRAARPFEVQKQQRREARPRQHLFFQIRRSVCFLRLTAGTQSDLSFPCPNRLQPCTSAPTSSPSSSAAASDVSISFCLPLKIRRARLQEQYPTAMIETAATFGLAEANHDPSGSAHCSIPSSPICK